jgi:hypothetical protein
MASSVSTLALQSPAPESLPISALRESSSRTRDVSQALPRLRLRWCHRFNLQEAIIAPSLKPKWGLSFPTTAGGSGGRPGSFRVRQVLVNP